MSFIKAVWFEGSKRTSGTVRSSWIDDKILYYPARDAYSALMKNKSPQENWLRFPLEKVKIADDNKSLVDAYEFETTATEADLDDTLSPPAKRKASPSLKGKAKRLMSDESDEDDDRGNASFIPKLPNTKNSVIPMRKSPGRRVNLTPVTPTRKSPRRRVNLTPVTPTHRSLRRSINLTPTQPSPYIVSSNSTLSPKNRTTVQQRSSGNTARKAHVIDLQLEDLSTPMCTNDSGPSKGSFPWSNAKFQDRVIFLLTDIRQMLRKSVNKINNTSEETDDGNPFKQLHTLEEFNELDNLVKMDKEERKKLVKFLSNCGGRNCQANVKLVYRKLMSNGLLSQVNYAGRGVKQGLENTEIYKIIEEIVTRRHGTEAEVKASVQALLKAAPDRPGGCGGKNVGSDGNEL